MEKYFKNNEYAKTNIRYQMEKIINPENRYAYIVYENYSDEYVKKGIELSKEYAHIRQ
jgi:hypothetical protein